jgi:hypothetical protein
MKILSMAVFLFRVAQAWCQPVPRSLAVRWNASAPDCDATP